MSLTLAQLIQPQSAAAFNQELLNGLQGVSNVVQTGTVPQSGAYAGVLVQLGTGTVQAAGPASASANVVVAITTSGNVGTGQFNYSINGGLAYNPSGPFTIPANVSSSVGTYFLPEVNVTLVFTNGTYSTPGVLNDIHSIPSTFVGGELADSTFGETYSFDTSVPNFPVTNWPVGGTARTMVQTDAQALTSLDTTLSQVIYGGYAESWISPSPTVGPPPSGWLDLLSQNFYNRQRYQGAQCQGIVQCETLSTAGPYTLTVGQLTAVSSQGQLFTNITAPTLTSGSVTPVTFGAATIGASFNSVVSDIPGFTATVAHAGLGTGTVSFIGNPYNYPSVVVKITTGSSGANNGYFDFSTDGGNTYSGSPILIGLMTGSPLSVAAQILGGQISVTFSGSANNMSGVFNLGDLYTATPAPLPGSNTIVALVNPLPGVTIGNYLQTAPTPVANLQPGSTGAITVSGIPNGEVTAVFAVITAGGVGVGTWTYSSSTLSTVTPVTIGTVTLANQTVTPTGSFEVGDTFMYSNSWRTQNGADVQSDPSLAAADQNQWSQLAPASPTGVYENLALQGSPEVVKSFVSVDPIVPGRVDIVLEGANASGVTPTAVGDVQSFIEAQAPLGVTVQVSSVIPVTMALTAPPQTFQCSPGTIGNVQATINSRMLTIQGNVSPGGFVNFENIIGALAIAGTPGGIPGLLNVAGGYNVVQFNGAGLESPPNINSAGQGGLQLSPNVVVSITPPPATAYGTFV